MRFGDFQVITTNGVRSFIAGGGRLQYVPEIVDGRLQWCLVGIQHDGAEIAIISPRKATARVFKTADAVLEYHKKMFPDDTEITLKFVPEAVDTDGKPTSG